MLLLWFSTEMVDEVRVHGSMMSGNACVFFRLHNIWKFSKMETFPSSSRKNIYFYIFFHPLKKNVYTAARNISVVVVLEIDQQSQSSGSSSWRTATTSTRANRSSVGNVFFPALYNSWEKCFILYIHIDSKKSYILCIILNELKFKSLLL